MRIIHCSDLHLTASPADREYCLGVLNEIVSLTDREKADLLIIAGDMFDSFPDLETLSGEVRSCLKSVRPGCRTIIIAGNHEYLGIGDNSLKNRDFGAEFIHAGPFELLYLPEIEVLAVPHGLGYGDYREWKVPKKKKPRLLTAHGPVAGIGFVGPEGEEGDPAVIDPDMFVRFQADYAALGHIHGYHQEVWEGTRLCYPGSARVWRRGEMGPRLAVLVEFNGSAGCEPAVLSRAGQYRFHDLPLNLSGELSDMDILVNEWGKHDRIELRLSGVIEREDVLTERIGRWIQEFSPQVRQCDILRDDVLVLEGISQQVIARKFLELWKAHRPEGDDPEDREIWLRAREIGLIKIKSVLDARP